MAVLYSANNFSVVVASSINSTATSLDVVSAAGAPDTPFSLTGGSEIMYVSAVVGNTLTISRGQEGSVAIAHTAGDTLENRLTAGQANDYLPEEGSDANGRYRKWADGTLECWLSRAVAVGDLTAGTKTRTWTFPVGAVFTSGSAYVLHAQLAVANATDLGRFTKIAPIRSSGRLGTSCTFYYIIATNFGSAGSEELYAIGRWI